jgi:peptidoglycan/LPS O-acetylase OafA/YrhL
MTQRHVLFLLLGLSAAASVLDVLVTDAGLLAPGWTLLCPILFSVLVFLWYRLDSNARGYRRTPLLNVGVIGLAFVAMPYYLVRSRPSGERGRALLRLAGFVLLMLLSATLCGAILALIF